MDVTAATEGPAAVAPAPYRAFAPLQAPPEPSRRVWTVFVALIAALATSAVFSVGVLGVFVAVMTWNHHAAHGRLPDARAFGGAVELLARDPVGILGAGLATCLSFALFALAPASLSPERFEDRLRLGPSRRWFAWGLLAALGMTGVGQVSSGVMALTGLERTGSLEVMRRAFADAPPHVLATAVVIVGLGAGVGEELFFRGYVLTRLARRWGSVVAVVVSAALFGLVHFDPLHSTFAFLVGLLLGWVSLRAGSIRPTIVAHVTNNVVATAGMALSSSAQTDADEATLGIALGVAAVTACVLGFRRLRPPGGGADARAAPA